jgi:pimeloyl-ACP methyl ester carboxylesterase
MRIDLGGCRLFFDVEGAKLRPDGPRMREVPTLILLHGGPGFDHSTYKPLFSALSDAVQLVYLDHRGQGRSDDRSNPEHWNLNQWTQDLKALCNALEIERPIVLGNSFGGFVAMAYGARYPDHPAKLILSSTAAASRPERRVAMFEKLAGPDVAEVARKFWDDPSSENMGDYMRICMPHYNPGGALADKDARRRTILNPEVAAHWIRGEGRTMNLFSELGHIICPTLVLAGGLDPVCTITDMEELVKAIPSHLVRFERFPDAGHGVFRDQPERALSILREFIAA